MYNIYKNVVKVAVWVAATAYAMQLHLLPFIKEQSMFIRVNRIFNIAFQISITQT